MRPMYGNYIATLVSVCPSNENLILTLGPWLFEAAGHVSLVYFLECCFDYPMWVPRRGFLTSHPFASFYSS